MNGKKAVETKTLNIIIILGIAACLLVSCAGNSIDEDAQFYEGQDEEYYDEEYYDESDSSDKSMR